MDRAFWFGEYSVVKEQWRRRRDTPPPNIVCHKLFTKSMLECGTVECLYPVFIPGCIGER